MSHAPTTDTPRDPTAVIGRRVLELRKMAGLSQKELARAIGLKSPDTLTRLENGTATRISLRVLLCLAVFAEQRGHDAAWLLGRPLAGELLVREDPPTIRIEVVVKNETGGPAAGDTDKKTGLDVEMTDAEVIAGGKAPFGTPGYHLPNQETPQ